MISPEMAPADPSRSRSLARLGMSRAGRVAKPAATAPRGPYNQESSVDNLI